MLDLIKWEAKIDTKKIHNKKKIFCRSSSYPPFSTVLLSTPLFATLYFSLLLLANLGIFFSLTVFSHFCSLIGFELRKRSKENAKIKQN